MRATGPEDGHPFPAFSAEARAAHHAALGGETWDLLVVGGGINGAAVARDAAGRGLRTALVEAADWGEGTSSRSSRLIHGGIRYLETFEFGLVFEASAERRRLLRLAPHLVHPLPFLFPVFRHDPVGPLKLRAGMWLYDALALFRNIGAHRMLSRARALEAEPRLRRDDLLAAATYYDAAVDDARLTLANVRGAHEAGAAVVSRAAVTDLIADAGAVRGAVVQDLLTGASTEVRARVVVNATGPWSDGLRRLADPQAAPRLRPTKGVHVMLHAERLGSRGAVTFRSPLDGRTMFVLPWGRFAYVGTTDTDFAGPPGEATATEEDVRYLLDSANALFPGAALTAEDVVSTWAGVRPLVAPAGDAAEGLSAGATSREHEIWWESGALLTVVGGKLTTYRPMAAEVVDAAARRLRREHGVESGISPTRDLPLPGAPAEPWDAFEARIRREGAAAGVGEETGAHLARAYGEDAEGVLAEARRDPALARRIVPALPYLWAEVPHAVRGEMALTLSDVLVRRLHIFYEAEDGGLSVARAVAERMAEEAGIGWDAAEITRQVETYRAEVKATRGFGGGPAAAGA